MKAEREKLNLTSDEVAETIKCRRHFIKALEEEAWDILPPSVFVKGFITAYARTVGLDIKQALDMYRDIAPEATPPLKPLAHLSPAHKGYLWLLFLCLAIAGGIWAWSVNPVEKTIPGPKVAVMNGGERNAAFKGEQGATKEEPVNQEAYIPKEQAHITQDESPLTLIFGGGEDRTAEVAGKPAESPSPLVLKGLVTAKTWVRVWIDHGQPVDYLLQPGNSPIWKAEKKFHLFIGNAGGIELELNGTPLGRPGNSGQVVRIDLPKD